MAISKLDQIIDRVDENDEIIGTTRRGDALLRGHNFRTVHVFIFDDAGRLLIQRIADGHPRHAGWWGSSVAGYVYVGETYEEAGRRRVREELGLEAVELRPAFKTSMQDGDSLKFVRLFTARSDGPFDPDPTEIADLEFVDLQSLPDMARADRRRLTPTFGHLLRRFLDHATSS